MEPPPIATATYSYATEGKQRKQVRNAFQHYVSPAVVDTILKEVGELKLGGEKKVLTAFFSDIRGFTSISEGLDPEDLVKFLNEYFSVMTRIIMKYEGTLDKFIGDAIMAFYGAPLPQPDHAVRSGKSVGPPQAETVSARAASPCSPTTVGRLFKSGDDVGSADPSLLAGVGRLPS